MENHHLRKALKDQLKMRKEDVDFTINELMRLHALLADEREAMTQKIKITDSMLYVVIS
ncbi:MAG: hypothetical protein Q4B28_06600 [bacterium]|nr:hypothetical protein [bacterium]